MTGFNTALDPLAGVSEPVRRLLLAASEMQRTRRLTEATQTLREAVAADPRCFIAHYNLGVVLAEQARFDDAIVAYRGALAVEPRSPFALANIGTALNERGKTDEAIEHFERSLAIAPELAQVHAYLGLALCDKGAVDTAFAAFDRALAIEPDHPIALATQGNILLARGDSEAAATRLRRALAVGAPPTPTLAHLSIALQLSGKGQEAAAYLDYGRLLRAGRLQAVEGWPSLAAFNTDLARAIYGHPTLRKDPETTTTIGSQTRELLNSTEPAVKTLRRLIEGAVADYRRTVLPQAPFMTMSAPPWPVTGWGVGLNSGGHQTAHFHPTAIVSGVYYVRVPTIAANSPAGAIQFGIPTPDMLGRDKNAAAASLLTATVKPEEGLLVLFPSYFWHQTIPFVDERERISIAFDVLG